MTFADTSIITLYILTFSTKHSARRRKKNTNKKKERLTENSMKKASPKLHSLLNMRLTVRCKLCYEFLVFRALFIFKRGERITKAPWLMKRINESCLISMYTVSQIRVKSYATRLSSAMSIILTYNPYLSKLKLKLKKKESTLWWPTKGLPPKSILSQRSGICTIFEFGLNHRWWSRAFGEIPSLRLRKI